MFTQSFSSFDSSIAKEFSENGYVVMPCENLLVLDELRDTLVDIVCEKIGSRAPKNMEHFLDNLHKQISLEKINELRMELYAKLNDETWFRPTYFSFGKRIIEIIVGSELAMQNRINLNIMMPNDDGSNIPVHVDSHSGESPFQCVMWLPLNNVYKSKSIFLLPSSKNQEVRQHYLRWLEEGGQDRVMREIESDVVYPTVPYGSFILFSSNLIHGSVVNRTDETRWSFNTRFKGLFTPYTSEEKGLGSFYLPIRISPASHFGLEYTSPDSPDKND